MRREGEKVGVYAVRFLNLEAGSFYLTFSSGGGEGEKYMAWWFAKREG